MPRFNGWVVGVSKREDGDMSILYSGEEVAMVNRKRFIEKQGLDFDRCVHTHLQHLQEIVEVGAEDGGKFFKVDGLMTSEKGVGLVIVTADCLPVVMYNGSKLALVHVSRNNVEIVAKAIEMVDREAQVWIGPCIKKESYVFENRDQLGTEWDSYLTPYPSPDPGEGSLNGKKLSWQMDLVGRVMDEIAKCKVQIAKIEISEVDTAKDTNYFSHYRAMKTGEPEGRFMTVAVMRE